MPGGLYVSVLLALALPVLGANTSPGKHREAVMLQAWSKQLEGSALQDTPVTRVTKLLEELMAQLKADLAEDEKLHCELMTWCNDAKWNKGEELAKAEDQVKFLISEIERLTALVAQLETEVKELQVKLKDLHTQMMSISTIRDKEHAAFRATEPDLISQVENLRAAIIVLDKHAVGGNMPDVKTERDAWVQMSLLQVAGSDSPADWAPEHESDLDRSMDKYLLNQDMAEDFAPAPTGPKVAKFLQHDAAAGARQQAHKSSALQMSAPEQMSVMRAVDIARAYAKQKGITMTQYTPGYTSQSGEILGMLKQMYETMKDDLGKEQAQESSRAKSFIELRDSLHAQIHAATLLLDRKEDLLAQAMMDLANDKEELVRTQQVVAGLTNYIKALLPMCAEAEKNFQLRKAGRLEEMKAVSETIGILQDDDARDAMASTYGETFLQVSSESSSAGKRRKAASALLRRAAKRTGNPLLSALATSVDLDAFTKVKKAIDDMIAMLKKQQSDEVKKKDWCVEEIQSTEMATMKKEDLRKDIEAKIEELKLHIKTLLEEIEAAKVAISDLESSLQRANIDRQKASLEFQKTVADQRASIEVLSMALDKLATYYDGKGEGYTIALQTWRRKAGFLQMGAVSFAQVDARRQPSSSSSLSSSTSVTVSKTEVDQSQFGSVSDIKGADGISHGVKDAAPVDLGQPVAIAHFKPSGGAGGVMQMIEKLIYDAKDLEATAVKSESEAQSEYEATVADTNASVEDLQRAIVSKTKEVGEAKEDLRQAESDLIDTVNELEDLSTYTADLHKECDYYMKNFDARQGARALEIEALQEAKNILSGAVLD